MKRNLITGVLALSSLLTVGQVLAADGVVHFRGEIVDSTCEVTPDTQEQNVDLGKVNKTAFTGVSSEASSKDFTISLQNCPDTYTKAAIRFDGTEDSNSAGDLAIGNPMETGTPGDYTGDQPSAIAATGVAIRIHNKSDNSIVKLYNDSVWTDIDPASHGADLKFIARYIQTTAQVTAGTGNADSQFTVEYQK
ncbi:TPA: fimbrial protein [Enterobacter asburiae]|nr:fimbrial protein [Enterobacter asburiae]